MQFREQGKRIQVLAYRGYDKVKKRATVKLLGSFDRCTYELADGLTESLTGDEKIELQSHIEKMRLSSQTTVRQYRIKTLPQSIIEVSDSLSDEELASHVSPQYGSEIYEAIDSLTKALRKIGIKRPTPVTASVDKGAPLFETR